MDKMDKLIGALIGLARATENNEDLLTDETDTLIIEGLAATSTADVDSFLERIEKERRRLIPNCYECASPCGHNEPFDMAELRLLSEEERSAKLKILEGARSVAARVLASGEREKCGLIRTALLYVGIEGLSVPTLEDIAAELDG